MVILKALYPWVQQIIVGLIVAGISCWVSKSYKRMKDYKKIALNNPVQEDSQEVFKKVRKNSKQLIFHCILCFATVLVHIWFPALFDYLLNKILLTALTLSCFLGISFSYYYLFFIFSRFFLTTPTKKKPDSPTD